jgi:hypothetical protein
VVCVRSEQAEEKKQDGDQKDRDKTQKN